MTDLGRRGAIGTIGAGLALGAMAGAINPARAAANGQTRLDFSKPRDRLKSYMLMRGALDERLVIGCVSGSYFGVVNDELTPLWDVVAATFARYRQRADGGYDGFTAEVAYFIDPETRRAPGRFLNPYTNEIAVEPQQGYAPAHIIIGADLSFGLGKSVPGLELNHHIKHPDVRGDDVWMAEMSRTALALPGATKPIRYSESNIMHARLADLQSPRAMRVHTEVSFTNFVSWRPWMKMGDRPGHMSAVGVGSFSDTMDNLPAEWVAATRERRPELLDNPGMLIDALWKAGR